MCMWELSFNITLMFSSHLNSSQLCVEVLPPVSLPPFSPPWLVQKKILQLYVLSTRTPSPHHFAATCFSLFPRAEKTIVQFILYPKERSHVLAGPSSGPSFQPCAALPKKQAFLIPSTPPTPTSWSHLSFSHHVY